MQRPLIVIAVIVVVLAPIIYVGSLGPVVWLESRGYIDGRPDSFIAWLYQPVSYAAIKYPAVGRPLLWYASLWRPQPTSHQGPANTF